MCDSIVFRNFEAEHQKATNKLYILGLKSFGIYGPDIPLQMNMYLEHARNQILFYMELLKKPPYMDCGLP